MSPWLIPLALLAGLLLGSLGGGGAILTVPILTGLVHQTPAQATAGSLVIVGLASLVGLIPNLRAKRVALADGALFGLLGIAGSLVGSKLSVSVPGPVLMTAFSVLLLVVAAVMVRKQLRTRGDAPEQAPAKRGWPTRIAAATVVGLLTGFFGVGGGFVVVPALTLVLGLSMTSAVATSMLVIAINAAVSLSARAASGLHLDWGLILPFAGFTVLGTLLGGRLAQRVGQRRLGWLFVGLLVAIAAYEGWTNIPALV